MKTFRDINGRDWALTIDVNSIERVIDLCGINLLKLFDGKFEQLAALFGDHFKLLDILWALVGRQSTDGATDDERAAIAAERKAFRGAIKGDSLEAAANALVDEVIDFFPDPKRRQALRDFMTTSWKATDLVLENAIKELSAVTPEALLSAIASQESLASIPAVSPSAN